MPGRRPRRRSYLPGGVAVLVLMAGLVACTAGSPKPAPTTTATTLPVLTINQGGDITVAAEGEPGCLDWISTCAGSSWGIWTVETNTMPRAYDFTQDNLYKPSILLAGDAQVQRSPEQVVTYQLNPRAVWSDGQPITSHDFKYTWDQIAHGQNIYDQSGYQNIVSVDDSDPRTAVVTFSQPYADWRRLFGGSYGVLPSHILEGRDRDVLMTDGYSWSGGPWELAPGGWVRGQSIKLVPNPNYWGKKPDLASVTFRIFTDPAAEVRAYAAGEVLAAYPAPEPASAGYRDVAATSYSAIGGLDFEALWFDVERTPVSDKAVRQAVAYSLDRAAIVSQLLAPLVPGATGSGATAGSGPSTTTGSTSTSTARATSAPSSTSPPTATTAVSAPPGLAPLQALLTPAYGAFYTDAFAKYRPDLTTAAHLMLAAGWTKGRDTLWTKAGQKATIDLKVPNTSPRLQQEAQLIQTQLRPAGFVVTLELEDPAALFTRDLPAGVFAAALYPVDLRRQLAGAVPPGVGIEDNDPSLCRLFCSTRIPATGNGGTGANYDRLRDATLDRYLVDLEINLADDARVNDATQAESILADLVPALPLAALPDIVVVNTAKLGVEAGTFSHNLAYGPYVYMNEWYLK